MMQVKMDLKVCEGCGGLWVRNGGEPGVYCRHCTVTLAEFPAPLAKRAIERKKRAAIHRLELVPQRCQSGGAR